MEGISQTAPQAAARHAAVDALRGLAILGVVLFHLVWDLDFLGLIPPGWATHPLWIAFGRILAGTFMALVGVSLALATRRGIDPRATARRLGRIALAALVISVATRVAFPSAWVYFGILHSIVVATLVGLASLRAPPSATALAGAAIVAAGFALESPAFDARWLAWIGFAAAPPPANDLAPVFPWAGFTLLGVAAARAALARDWLDRLPRTDGPAGRSLATAGRWSLAIYLVHQPVLLALLVPLARIVG